MSLLAKGEGFAVPPVTHLLEWAPLATFQAGPVTINVTALTIIMFAMVGLVSTLFVLAFANPKVVPTGLQNLMEAGVDQVRTQIVNPVLGADGERWLPYLTCLFFFVFSLNFLEVIPGVQFPATSRMAIPVVLSVLTYVIFNVVGIAANGPIKYFKANLFPPGVPKPIYIILTPIELMSTFVFRPVTLAVRLFANMMAGHVMLTIFFLATAYFLYGSDSLFLHIATPIPFLLAVILVGFEMFVGLIQAFIITILTAVYIAGAKHAH